MMTQDRATHPLALDHQPSYEELIPSYDDKQLGVACSLHMLPGDVYYYAANSSVLCVQRDEFFTLARKTPTSPRNLNPSAPAFRQGQAAPTSPKNLNPSAPVFRHSSGRDKSPTEATFSGADTKAPGVLTNGDIYANGTNYVVPIGGADAGLQMGAAPQGAHLVQGQSLPGEASVGLAVTQQPQLPGCTQSNQGQVVVAAVAQQQQHQSGYVMGMQDNVDDQLQLRTPQSHNSPANDTVDAGDSPPDAAVGVAEEILEHAGDGQELEGAMGGQEYKYPDEILAPITKQMQFYFSNENLPNDKFLNQHMDSDKFIPLELFLDFGRIKPICNSVDQLLQAVESSSILELSEDRKRVRVSQCRKTLTLRGFPASATEEDVRQFILEMGASVPTHIEFVMYKEKYSVWYVSFKDETTALNSFFQFHNQKAVYKDHNIGCCIKSSGTLAAAGYFPSSEESNQRRLAHQTQAAAAAPVHAVPSPIQQPQPQQAQALMQPFSTMQLHPYIPGSPTNIYYQQTQGPYMPYMAGMIQGWPAPSAAMEPGLIMQNNGLQPQHIRTSMPRPHLIPSSTGAHHRFNSRPQRTRQNNLERSASERPGDRPPVVSVSGSSRSSPRSADGITVVPQVAYVHRRTTEEITPQVIQQPHVVPHQFVTPLVTQQQHPVTSTAGAPAVNQGALEPLAIPHYQHHQQSVIGHTTMTGSSTAHPPPAPQSTNNPPPSPQQHHHHSQPAPPAVHPQQHHIQQPHQGAQLQQQQQQTHHPVQHNQHQPQPQPHHHQQAQTHHHQHHSHQQSTMTPHHHHHPPQQQHHSMNISQAHHQQPLLGNRPERRGRRKREDNIRSQRSERNQSNRSSFSSQVPAAADNFTMEANSFPPLPGALNSITSSEISHENMLSDVVRGFSRMSGPGIPRASSSTPSPVATPIPSGASTSQHHHHQAHTASALLDTHSVDDVDSPLDDDTTSSSQEEVDTDGNSLECRSVRSEPQSTSFSAEPSSHPGQSRYQKASTPIASPAVVSTQRQSEGRQGSVSSQAPARGPQQTVHHQQQYQVSPTAVSAVHSSFEAPKLSYAQILAQKNPDGASTIGTGENSSTGALSPNLNSGTQNGPNSVQANNTTTTVGCRASSQSANTIRDHGNHQGGPPQSGSRPSQRGPSKDLSRSEGPQPSSRPPNGSRRNSKENRTSNKFDRKKPDARQK